MSLAQAILNVRVNRHLFVVLRGIGEVRLVRSSNLEFLEQGISKTKVRVLGVTWELRRERTKARIDRWVETSKLRLLGRNDNGRFYLYNKFNGFYYQRDQV